VRRTRALAVLVVVAACSGLDVKTATYANMAEAQPAIAEGLMPPGLPRSSFELRAAYVPGGSRQWGILNFPAAGAEELRALLQPEELSLTGVRLDIPPRIEWWPVQLRKSLDDERIKATGAKAYRAKSGGLFFVVNWAQGRAYYFTPAKG
jgi:hypothetical protein